MCYNISTVPQMRTKKRGVDRLLAFRICRCVGVYTCSNLPVLLILNHAIQYKSRLRCAYYQFRRNWISSKRSFVYHQVAEEYTFGDDIQPQRGWWYTNVYLATGELYIQWYTKSATWIKKYCRKCILFCSIFWCGRRDLILARTARSVFHGRGRPPEVRSVPFPLQAPPKKARTTRDEPELFLLV